MTSKGTEGDLALIVTLGARACAIPLENVGETMRALPIEPVDGAPPFVRGLSIVRGAPVPVVALDVLLEGRVGSGSHARFVTMKVGERRVALVVDDIVGITHLGSERLATLPPLLGGAPADLLGAIGTLDERLLLVLRAARLMPDDVWAIFPAAAPS